MWSFKKKVKPGIAVKPVFDILKRGTNRTGITSEVIIEAYAFLSVELEKRLNAGDLHGLEQEQNVRDVKDITMCMSGFAFGVDDSCPELFTHQKVIQIYRQIGRAAEYCRGTEYEEDTTESPREFLKAIALNKRCQRSMRKCRESMSTYQGKKIPA